MEPIQLSSAKLSKRIEGIQYSNDMLSHGISELEALYLRMQSGLDKSNGQAKENISILNRRNHSLAQAINEALKEVESTLRDEMETGVEIDKEIIHQFTIVLRESIRIFHEYRLLQEGYKRLESKGSFHHYLTRDKNKDKTLPIVYQLHRFIKTICVCGAIQ